MSTIIEKNIFFLISHNGGKEKKEKKNTMKVVAENYQWGIIEKNGVKDVPRVSRKLAFFLLIPRSRLEIYLLTEDSLTCSHSLTLIACPRLVGWVCSLFPWIYASSLSWKCAPGQSSPSVPSSSCPSASGTDGHVCYYLPNLPSFWTSPSLDWHFSSSSYVWSPFGLPSHTARLDLTCGLPRFPCSPSWLCSRSWSREAENWAMIAASRDIIDEGLPHSCGEKWGGRIDFNLSELLIGTPKVYSYTS